MTDQRPCTRGGWGATVPGQACDDCGHTNLVHPGDHNPALRECLLCQLAATVQASEQRQAADS